jgi:hypothetical protein
VNWSKEKPQEVEEFMICRSIVFPAKKEYLVKLSVLGVMTLAMKLSRTLMILGNETYKI